MTNIAEEKKKICIIEVVEERQKERNKNASMKWHEANKMIRKKKEYTTITEPTAATARFNNGFKHLTWMIT